MPDQNEENKGELGHRQHHEECEPIDQKLHELHEHEEERLHGEHIKEEEALHNSHVAEEERLHREHEAEEEAMRLVDITVDGKVIQIDRGLEPVSEIKLKAGVAAAYTLLEENNKGQFLPLDNSATVCIKGCEVFESQAPHGGSS